VRALFDPPGGMEFSVYFSPDILKALRMKAAATHRSVSEMVNEAEKMPWLTTP